MHRIMFAVVVVAHLPLGLAEGAEPALVNRAAAIGLRFGPDTTVVDGPLSADGLPDYVGALNDRLSAGVSREENFWVLMWPALGNAERSSPAFIRAVEERLGISIAPEPRLLDPVRMAGFEYSQPEGTKISDQQGVAAQRPWTREEFPQITRWVDAHAAILEEVHAACQRPKAFAPMIASVTGEPGLMVGILLPHVQALRAVARVQSSRAMLRLGEGDVEGAWQDLLDLHRIAGHCERGPTLIEALVGYAIRNIAAQPMGHWVARSGLSAEALAQRQAVLQPLLKTNSLAGSIDCERFMYLDTVVCLLSGRMTSREVLNLLEPSLNVIGSPGDESAAAMNDLRTARQMVYQLLVLGSDVNETLRYGNRMYDDLVAALRQPTHAERRKLLDAIDDRVQRDGALSRDAGALVAAYLLSSREQVRQMPARVLTGLLMPAITQVENAQTRVDAYAAILNAAFAVQSHFATQGEVPLSLQEIAGSNAATWIDPFTNAPVLMKVDERGLVLYSVGQNGQDDGGRYYGEGENSDDPRIVLPIAP